MVHTIVAGVDPGLVHTGVVVFDFDPENHTLDLYHEAIDGLDASATLAALEQILYPTSPFAVTIYIERYRPRHGYDTDERMLVANAEFASTLRGTLLRNTGVKQVVTRELMEKLEVWKFTTSTHHADLRSAARIALLGMLLDQQQNQIVYDYVTDNLRGSGWHVRHH